jgi:hypothetical protein
MTEYASEEDLVAGTAEDSAEDFVLKSGKTIRIRSLTRAEHLWTGKGTDDPSEIEARMVSAGLVAPAMSVAKVKAWQKTAGTGTIAQISDKIRDLSGFGDDAEKSDLPGDGEQT